MQHPTHSAVHFDGHFPMRVVLKFLFLAALGALVIVFHSLALLMIAGLGMALTLAVQERICKLDARTSQTDPLSARYVSDGGAFPGREPEPARSRVTSPRVIDGGSLERHRH